MGSAAVSEDLHYSSLLPQTRAPRIPDRVASHGQFINDRQTVLRYMHGRMDVYAPLLLISLPMPILISPE